MRAPCRDRILGRTASAVAQSLRCTFHLRFALFTASHHDCLANSSWCSLLSSSFPLAFGAIHFRALSSNVPCAFAWRSVLSCLPRATSGVSSPRAVFLSFDLRCQVISRALQHHALHFCKWLLASMLAGASLRVQAAFGINCVHRCVISPCGTFRPFRLCGWLRIVEIQCHLRASRPGVIQCDARCA